MAEDLVHDDDAYLRQFGIEPKLKRAIGFISSSLFAIAFQGPTTGALLITGATLAFGGPAFIWAIPLIFVFQFLIALTWAELSSHYPLEGGIYQWGRLLGGEGIGWATGLFYLVAIILVMPAVGLVINIVLAGVFPDQIKFNPTTEIVISFLVIIATALIMSTSVRVVALINNVGVTLELIILGGTALLLLGHVHQPLSVLFSTKGVEGTGSYLTPFLIVVALVITQFVGFETAGAFAEETKNSRVSPARAIMTALGGACLFVFFFDFALILSLPDVGKAMTQPETFIPATLTANFGDFGAKVFLAGAFIAVSSTSIATLAAIVRTMYGMARDNQLPASRYLTRLAGNGEPIICIVVAALLSMVPLLFVQQIPVLIAGITFMILVPYFLVLASLIRKRLGGWPTAPAPFKLGSWGMPLAIVGIIWVAFVAIDAAWPRAATNPNLGQFPILEELAVITAVLGALWWFLVIGRRAKTPVEPGVPAKPAMR
ncbi:MAG: APC family permease [Candidatus Dormibacteraeota bacterium]|nr:APC family permease [Candidatus Dormibacteraeota bacterium]